MDGRETHEVREGDISVCGTPLDSGTTTPQPTQLYPSSTLPLTTSRPKCRKDPGEEGDSGVEEVTFHPYLLR